MAIEKTSEIQKKAFLSAAEVKAKHEEKANTEAAEKLFNGLSSAPLAKIAVEHILDRVNLDAIIADRDRVISIPIDFSKIYTGVMLSESIGAGVARKDGQLYRISRQQLDDTRELLIKTLFSLGYRVGSRGANAEESWGCDGYVVFCLPDADTRRAYFGGKEVKWYNIPINF